MIYLKICTATPPCWCAGAETPVGAEFEDFHHRMVEKKLPPLRLQPQSPARHSRRCPIRLQIQCGQDQHPVDDEANAIEFGQEFGQEREHRRAGTLSRRR